MRCGGASTTASDVFFPDQTVAQPQQSKISAQTKSVVAYVGGWQYSSLLYKRVLFNREDCGRHFVRVDATTEYFLLVYVCMCVYVRACVAFTFCFVFIIYW